MEYSGYLSEKLGLQASSIQEAIEFIRDGGTAELEHVLELARAVEDGDVESAQLALEYVNKYRRMIFDEGLYHFPKQKSIQDYVETFIQEVKDLLDEREEKWVESRKDPWKELAKEFGIADDIEQFTKQEGGTVERKCTYIINGPFFSKNPQLCGRPARFKVDDIPGWSGLDFSQAFFCEEHLKLSLQSFPETIYHPIKED